MKKNIISITHRFNIIFIALLGVTILINLIVMGFAMFQITAKISQGYAKMYATEIANVIETHLSREVGLSLKLAQTPSIISWMTDEENESKKSLALEEIASFIDIFHDHNMFIAMNHSKNIYYPSKDNELLPLKSQGTLSNSVPEDNWYFNTLNSDEAYNINIDNDRFLDIYRVWINVKVMDHTDAVGVIGTGLYLDYFINEQTTSFKDLSTYTLVINRAGDIQIDGPPEMQNHLDNYSNIYAYVNDTKFSGALAEFLNSTATETVLKLNEGNFDYAALSSIKDTNWYVVTLYNSDTFYTSSNLLLFLLMMILSIIVLIVIINVFVKRIFVNPFMKLIQSLQNRNIYISKELFGMDRDDEFGLLANTIEQMSDRIVSSIPVGLFLVDCDFKLIYSNLNLLSQFNAPDKEAFSSLFNETPELIFANPDDFQRIKSILASKENLVILEIQFVKFSGEVFWGELHIQYKNDDDITYFYECILLNTQSKKDYEAELLNLATTDALTGLYNRFRFDELVVEEIERSERYGGPLSLIIFDLDHFKQINDTYGHIVGDEVLIEISKISKEILRTTDIIARWGGEEFSILLPGTTSSGAYIAAEKLRQTLENYQHSTVGAVTASFGVSQKLQDEDYTQWFSRVDQALFKSKNSGRNKITVSIDALTETKKTPDN
ncbi:sensor domain-containing diguanylate cyclase [Fusibacter bizertensis]